MTTLSIFTDGSCLGNPGAGGYGIILQYGQHEKQLSGGYFFTTNNRMELMAVIVALESLKRPVQQLMITTDSQYVQLGISRWINTWKKQRWKKREGGAVMNKDLWQRLDQARQRHGQIDWHWVRGHTGHPENERCDQLALSAAKKPTQIDTGYPGIRVQKRPPAHPC